MPAPIGHRRLTSLAAELDTGCYPEGGPSPVSSVTINMALHAPPKRVSELFALLAKHGWPREHVTIQPWTHQPATAR